MACVFIFGTDNKAIPHCAKIIAAKYTSQLAQENTTIVDASSINKKRVLACISQVCDALLVKPLFYEKKFIWLKNAAFFTDNTKQPDSELDEALAHLLLLCTGLLPPFIDILIDAPNADIANSFVVEIRKTSRLIEVNKPTIANEAAHTDVIKWVISQSAGIGVDVSFDAANLLAAHIGIDTEHLFSILLQIAEIQPSGEVNTTAVAALIQETPKGLLTELQFAILRKHVSKIPHLIHALVGHRITPYGILHGTIIPTIRAMTLVSNLVEQHAFTIAATSDMEDYISGLNQSVTHMLPKTISGNINTGLLVDILITAKSLNKKALEQFIVDCGEVEAKILRARGDIECYLNAIIFKYGAS